MTNCFQYSIPSHPDSTFEGGADQSEVTVTASTLAVKASDISSPDLGVDVGSDPFSSLERPNPANEGKSACS